MSEFIRDNHVNNLPDCYCKSKNSNNFKLLELERLTLSDFRKTLQELYDILDINNTKGITLDYYGDTVGVERGNLTDTQYLIMIKAKIVHNLSNGSYPSVLNALCSTFNCHPSEINIIEADEPCKVKAVVLPLGSIVNSGLSIDKCSEVINQLLPTGISLDTYLYEGTFIFAESENEHSNDSGFSDFEGGTIGGYLGYVQGGN